MSLDYNFERIKNWKEVCWIPSEEEGMSKLNPDTDILIWASLAVDLGEIKESNADEWWYRMRILQKIGRGVASKGEEQEDGSVRSVDYMPSREVIEQHVGLYTNVLTLSRAKWFGKIREGLFRDVEYELRKERQAAAKEVAA